MKISNVKTYLVEGIKYNWTLVRSKPMRHSGWAKRQTGPAHCLLKLLVNNRAICHRHDARRIDYIWTKIYRDMHWLGPVRSLLSAISALDIACGTLRARRSARQSMNCLGGNTRSDSVLCQLLVHDGDQLRTSYAQQAKETVAARFTALS